MKMYRAEIKRGNEIIKRNNVVKIGGYIAGLSYKGVGEANYTREGDEYFEEYKEFYAPYFNSSKIKNLSEFKKKIEGLEITDIIGSPYEECLLKEGENENLFVRLIDIEEEKMILQKEEEEKIKKGEAAINFCWGVFGLKTTTRMPEELLSLVKKFGSYYYGTEEDVEFAEDMDCFGATKADCKGWFFGREAIDFLKEKGYKVSFRGVEVKKDFATTEKEIKEQETRFRERKLSAQEKWNVIMSKAEIMTTDEAIKVDLSKEIHISLLRINGHNIFGSGMFLSIDEKYLYICKNNGMDGDDWTHNNISTGGAGAILYRVPLTRDIEDFLDEYVKKKEV